MPSSAHPSRRSLLLASAAAVPLVAMPTQGARAKGLEGVQLSQYRPVFFTEAEWAFTMAACDRLIPAEGRGPGALETNVPVFIDQQLKAGLGSEIYLQGPFKLDAPATLGFQMSHPPQEVYRIGIRLAQQYSQQHYGKRFEQLAAADQDALLTALQKNGVDFAALGEATLKASQFFGQLLGDAKNGYLADPMYGGNKDKAGWKLIGFPGVIAVNYQNVEKYRDKPFPTNPVSISDMS